MYYYRPRRSSASTTTRSRPSVSRDRLRQEQQAHKPIADTPERHEPPDGIPATGIPDQQAQATPVLDTHTLLLLLLLMERLTQAEGKEHLSPPPPIETEDLVVESIPPKEEEGQNGEYPPSHSSRTPRLAVILLALCVLICLAVIATALVPLMTASATVTIIPVQREITAHTTLSVVTSGTVNPAHQQVPGRRLSSLILSQEETVPTTGRGSQQATQAHGMLTFYNALPQVQSIPAGTLLTSGNGIQIVTEQDAVIPAGTGAVNREVSVTAHAIQAGPQGNIAAGTISGPCCRAYVLVTNRSTFGGGQNVRSFPMVLQQDIGGVVSTLKTSLSQSEQAAFQAQVRSYETLITPVACTPKVTSSHAAGDEATQVTITVEDTCSGETYATQALRAQVLQVVTGQATVQLGSGYALTGDVQVTVRSGTLTHQQQGTLTLQLSGTGTWAYQFDETHLLQMAHLIAGKSREQATQVLLQLPGVSQVSMTTSGTGSPTSVPADASRIHLLVLYRTV